MAPPPPPPPPSTTLLSPPLPPRRYPHKTTERNSKVLVVNRSASDTGSPTHTPSPQGTPPSPSTLVVRVSISTEANCCYKSILVSRCGLATKQKSTTHPPPPPPQLSESERTGSVIKSALEKHGITSNPSHYKLVQVLEDSSELGAPSVVSFFTTHHLFPPSHTHDSGQVEIPDNVNVFYALSSLTSPMLTLKEKELAVQ